MSEPKKISKIKDALENAQTNIQVARQLLAELGGDDLSDEPEIEKIEGKIEEGAEGKIIEGMFDGQNMIGPDGKQYSVPANYASKSKLVEGDTLKLTITPDGSFVYKQIGPAERQRLIGTLTRDEQTSEFRVLANNKSYRVLLASITYFKGESGDEAVILVPKEKDSKWAAVENIIKKAEINKNGLSADEPTEEASSEIEKIDE